MKKINLNFFIEYRFEINNFVHDLFRRFDCFHEKNKSINNFAKKSNSYVFHITVLVIQKLSKETQMLLKKAQR